MRRALCLAQGFLSCPCGRRSGELRRARAGADPTKRTLPDQTFRTGVTPFSITQSEAVKRAIQQKLLEIVQGHAEEAQAAEALESARLDSIDAIVPLLFDGKGAMPPFNEGPGSLSEAEMRAVASYVLERASERWR